MKPAAEKRLKVLQSLDKLGAGFILASHDLDIRGAGNLLGEEQSGHIREVGFELYQSMLEEAVATLKGGDESIEDQWSPRINLGTSVLIPEPYVPDLQVRLGLYRRLAAVEPQAHLQIGHVRLGNENRGAEIDARRPLILDRLVPALQRGDGLFQHGLVELEAHFADMAGLLLAEEIAGASDIEVVTRQDEAGAQLVERLKHLQPLLRRRLHPGESRPRY